MKSHSADNYDEFPLDIREGDVIRYEPDDVVKEHLRRRDLRLEASPSNPNHFIVRHKDFRPWGS